ncbi:hypothetical protein [Streptomyces sp. NPDC002328]|uniref:hypothetical protein n=1 Tax=Streptomyces sp. NPDC002328 TaxID=3364642 RepID=UPI00367F4F07
MTEPHSAAPARTCHHVIAHWTTDEERQQLVAALAYARDVGDAQALPLLIAQLTQPCDARTPKDPTS